MIPLLQRQPNLKACPAGSRFETDVAVMFPNDSSHEIQAESCAVILLFGRKERFENPILDFEGNSRAAIAYFYEHTVRLRRCSDEQ